MPAPTRKKWKEVDSLTEATSATRGLAEAAAALLSAGLPVELFESSDGIAAIVLTPAAVAGALEAGIIQLTSAPASSNGELVAPIVLTATNEIKLRQDDLVDMVPSGAAVALVGYPPGKPGGAQYRTGTAGTLEVPASSATFHLHVTRLRAAAAVSQVRARAGKLPEHPDTLTRREEWFRKRSGRL